MKKLNCILLVDDNVDDNFFHTLAIKDVDAAEHIKTATTGEKAISYLEKAVKDATENPIPQLVFLDINMPGMNGFEFLEMAKERNLIHVGKPIVVVMLTSSLNSADEALAREKYAEEISLFKNKPLTAEMLKEIMSQFF